MFALAQSVDPVERIVLDNPEFVVVLALVLRLALAWQRQLSWYEYRTLHGLRRMVFPRLATVLPYDSFVNDKGYRQRSDEYLTTRKASVKATAKKLQRAGGSLHLLSSLKHRRGPDGDPYSRAHVVWVHDDGTQTEAYLFANYNGTTDVYAHHEASVTNPAEHLTGDQRDGDVRGIVTEALED